MVYGYHPVLPVELLKGDEQTNVESVGTFVERTQEVWSRAQEQMKKAVTTQKTYYDRKHRDVQFKVGDSVLLSTQNLRLKGIPHKLQRKFCGPYKVLERIGTQAYRLQLPTTWRIHPRVPCVVTEAMEAEPCAAGSRRSGTGRPGPA